jgi:ribosomal-protein-alanine N-acetyltransferase
MPNKELIATQRLRIRPIEIGDAAFLLRLLNDPAFIRNIADRNVRTLDDAVRYMEAGPIASYAKNGFGLWLVTLADSGEPAGICGLLRRDVLPDVDIGYAFLPEFTGRGYAFESARAVLEFGRNTLGFRRIVAVVDQDNAPSIRLLEKLGFRRESTVRLAPNDKELLLFADD